MFLINNVTYEYISIIRTKISLVLHIRRFRLADHPSKYLAGFCRACGPARLSRGHHLAIDRPALAGLLAYRVQSRASEVDSLGSVLPGRRGRSSVPSFGGWHLCAVVMTGHSASHDQQNARTGIDLLVNPRPYTADFVKRTCGRGGGYDPARFETKGRRAYRKETSGLLSTSTRDW